MVLSYDVNFASCSDRLAFISSVLCLFVSFLECGGRLSEKQVLISPVSALKSYEYLGNDTFLKIKLISTGFVLSFIFWIMTSAALYRELDFFTMQGVWKVRFSLCLAAAGDFIAFRLNDILNISGQIAKLVIVYKTVGFKNDPFAVIAVISGACHLFLAIFAISQIPQNRYLSVIEINGYQASAI